MSAKKGVELLSAKLVKELFKSLPQKEKEVLTYGVTVLLSTLGSYLLLIVISYLVGVTSLSLTAAVTASLLRIFSGGVHASQFKNCAFLGTSVFTLLGLISQYCNEQLINLDIILLIIFVAGSLIIYLYAPAAVKEKPITNKMKYSKFKIYSFIIFSSLMLVYYILNWKMNFSQFILAGLLGIIWQLFTITPLAYDLLGRSYLMAGKKNNN